MPLPDRAQVEPPSLLLKMLLVPAASGAAQSNAAPDLDTLIGRLGSLEYPVRTINLNVEEGLFQIDTGPTPLPDMNGWDGTRPKRAFLTFVASSDFDFAEFILRREVEPSEEDKKWLFQLRGKWRWELRDPKNPPPGHPPRPPWPTTYNETLRLNTTNEFFCAEI